MMRPMPEAAGPSALDKHQIQASALDLSYFMSKSKCKFINLIHTRQKNRTICSCSWKIINKMVLKCHNMKNINNFTQWKNEPVNVTFMRAIMLQKHLAQSGCSMRSAVDIFNTLHVREQEIKLECMNGQ